MSSLTSEMSRDISTIRAHFSPDTAMPGSPPSPPSAGHCAAVAILLHKRHGAEIWSAKVNGVSHWFNRVKIDTEYVFVDATADQFGECALIVDTVCPYPEARSRGLSEANNETIVRAQTLERRCGWRE